MRITLNQLRNLEQPVIELLEIISLEGQHYMARLHGPEGLMLLSDDNGQTHLFRSAWQLQDTLSDLDVRETQIVHPSAYHEMVGMEPTELEPMRIQVQRQRS
ncbi:MULTISPECIES: DUF6482 family protein [Marinobacter]|uniref:Cation transporter n=2 Tax=Marinobacter TaxID=2742 RepID=A0A455W636_MARNT|nr:MAG: hypothetical protein CVV16_04450 [Gammaproteobacteria bacterium HGW-Gammaproteobacteria-6]BBJ02407.1 hypothetical protein YBY_02550 [Marinobacter nauticus]